MSLNTNIIVICVYFLISMNLVLTAPTDTSTRLFEKFEKEHLNALDVKCLFPPPMLIDPDNIKLCDKTTGAGLNAICGGIFNLTDKVCSKSNLTFSTDEFMIVYNVIRQKNVTELCASSPGIQLILKSETCQQVCNESIAGYQCKLYQTMLEVLYNKSKGLTNLTHIHLLIHDLQEYFPFPPLPILQRGGFLSPCEHESPDVDLTLLCMEIKNLAIAHGNRSIPGINILEMYNNVTGSDDWDPCSMITNHPMTSLTLQNCSRICNEESKKEERGKICRSIAFGLAKLDEIESLRKAPLTNPIVLHAVTTPAKAGETHLGGTNPEESGEKPLTTNPKGSGQNTLDVTKPEGSGQNTLDATKPEGSGQNTLDGTKSEGSGKNTLDATKPEGSGQDTLLITKPEASAQQSVDVTKPEGSVQQSADFKKPQGSIQKPIDVTKPEGSVQLPFDNTKPQESVQQPLDGTKPQGSVQQPLDGTKPQGSVQQPIDITKPEGSIQQPLDVTKLQGSVQQPVDISKPEGSVQRPLDVTKPQESVQQPVDLTKPEGSVQQPGDLTKPGGSVQQPVDITKPEGSVQQPLDVIKPEGSVQQPGDLTKPGGSVQQPVDISKPEGSVQQPLDVTKPEGSVQQPVDITKTQGSVQQPINITKPQGSIKQPLDVTKPEGSGDNPVNVTKSEKSGEKPESSYLAPELIKTTVGYFSDVSDEESEEFDDGYVDGDSEIGFDKPNGIASNKDDKAPSESKKLSKAQHYAAAGKDEAEPAGISFMSYFLVFLVLCVAGYIVFHNKQKIIALVIEGKSAHNGRRPNSKEYRRLKTDDVMPSLEKSASSTNYVY